MAACLRVIPACAMLLVLPVSSLPAWAGRWLSCERRAPQEVLPRLTSKLEEGGLRENDIIRRISEDLRADGALRVPSDPVAYAVMGGGKWGPRAVASALLEGLYVAWEAEVVLLDMEEAVRLHRSGGLEEAQMWLKSKVVAAIERCPQKAAVVLDNVHVLTGRDVVVLDPLLLLFDSTLSQIDYDGRKVSGAGSLFLLLFNEESSANNAGLSGKDRLQQAWEYHMDKAFTPSALIGRIDAAFVMSSEPRLSSTGLSMLQDDWLKASGATNPSASTFGDVIVHLIGDALGRVDENVVRTCSGLAVAIATVVVAGWALGCFGGKWGRAAPTAAGPDADATNIRTSTDDDGKGRGKTRAPVAESGTITKTGVVGKLRGGEGYVDYDDEGQGEAAEDYDGDGNDHDGHDASPGPQKASNPSLPSSSPSRAAAAADAAVSPKRLPVGRVTRSMSARAGKVKAISGT